MKRTFISVISIAIGIIFATSQTNLVWGADTSPQATAELVCNRKANQISHVELTFETGGELKYNRDNQDKLVPVKMNANGKLAYDERLLPMAGSGEKLSKSVRYYQKAEAVLKLGSTTLTPTLRPEYRLIAAQGKDTTITLFSPTGALTREELDLIAMPGNTLVIDRLLPGKTVEAGDRWKHSPDVSAALLGLDRVTKTTLESTLVSVVDRVARVEVAGEVKGSIDGSQTQIEVKGKYQVNLGSTKQVTWAGILIKENRQPGEASTGLQAVTLLQMTITPVSASPHLTDAALKGIPLSPTNSLTQLTHRSADNIWTLSYSRDWYMNTDEREMTVLRLIDDGLRKSQCNIKVLPKLASGRAATLAKFEQEVRDTLAKNNGKLVEAKELRHVAGYRLFHIVMTGEVANLPIQWNYYLAVNDQGYQVVFAFTAVTDDVSNSLLEADRQIVNAFRFSDSKMAKR